MPFTPARFQRLCELKGLNQAGVGRRAGVSQPTISDCNRGIGPSVDVLEKLATALDCTTDFLLGRYRAAIDESADLFRASVSRMAFQVFEDRIDVGDEHKERCRRVLGHPDAPITADGWAILAEQIQLAIGPADGSTGLRLVHQRGS